MRRRSGDPASHLVTLTLTVVDPAATVADPLYDTVNVCVPLESLTRRVARPGRPIARSSVFSFFEPSDTVAGTGGCRTLGAVTISVTTALPLIALGVTHRGSDCGSAASVGADVFDDRRERLLPAGDLERQALAEVGAC